MPELTNTSAGIANFESTNSSSLASLCNLERIDSKTCAGEVELERVVKITIAGLVDLTYSQPIPESLVETIDARAESTSTPIVRYKIIATIPAGMTEISARFRVNCKITGFSALIPPLEAKTVVLQIFDEMGANVYESASMTQSQTKAMVDLSVEIAGLTTVNLKLSAAISIAAKFAVLIYGK